MSDQFDNPGEGVPVPPPGPGAAGGPDNSGFFSERIQHQQVAAKLPERIIPGVFCTGAIVLEGPEEFVVDFIQGVVRPPRVGARVILGRHVMAQLVAALKDNLARYEQQFGPPKPMPKPQIDRRPSIQELYDDLKMADDQLSGQYANAVMIGHSPAEFFMDFITRFFPKAAVSARVFIAASHLPRVLETLTNSYQQYLRRLQAGPLTAPPPPTPENPPPGDGV